MATNLRETVVNALSTLLQTITVANGYNTNIGAKVYQKLRDPDELGNDEFPCLMFLSVNENIEFYAAKQRESRLTISILGFIKLNEDENSKASINKLADDVIVALLSAQDLNQATVDYPERFSVETFVTRSYGQLQLDIEYIFERNF